MALLCGGLFIGFGPWRKPPTLDADLFALAAPALNPENKSKKS